MWLQFAVFGYAILAGVAVLDKFLISKRRVTPPLFTWFSAFPVLLVLFLVPFGVRLPGNGGQWLSALISGLAFTFALWTMYRGYQESEVSHAGPLVGASVAVFAVWFGRLFLGEELSTIQYWAVALLVTGSLLVAFERSRRHNGWHRGMLWIILAGALYATSHVASRYLYGAIGFYSGFVWSRGVMGMWGAVLLLHPAVQTEIRGWFSRGAASRAARQNQPGHLALMITNQGLGVGAVILLQYAISLGSVGLVGALSGVREALLIILVAILSRFRPTLFREQYARGELLQEVLAVAFITAGIVMLVR